jgi:Polysaccharide lyase
MIRVGTGLALALAIGLFVGCSEEPGRGPADLDLAPSETQTPLDGNQDRAKLEGAPGDLPGSPEGPAVDQGKTDSATGPKLKCTLAWSSGFEKGFPGEWLNYDNGSWSAGGSMPAARVSAWTIIKKSSGKPVYAGSHGYKGWIVGKASDSHRAYPVVHLKAKTPLVNTFMVYLDADYSKMSSSEWIHFGTWGNAKKWALHTMSVRNKKLEFAHTSPQSGTYIGPKPQPQFPLGKWVRFTAYLHYKGTTGFVQVWQDGVAVFKADVSQLSSASGTTLERAHWGMYASKETSQGIQYNDEIRVWTLAAPLTDLKSEPRCF